MVTLKITFLTGQYHATPWGRNVNEGVPEWPPSPFRLFRAMFDSWKRKCPDIDERVVESILAKMSSIPPHYLLPDYTTSHIRYYLSQNTKDVMDKQKIFDAFVVVNPEDHLLMTWPDVNLQPDEKEAVSRIIENLNFLGRSESWVSICLVDDAERKFNCIPLQGGEGVGGAKKIERVACLSPKDQFVPTPLAKGRKQIGWLDAVTYGTAEMLKEGRNAPPLLVHLDYVMPDENLLSGRNARKMEMGREINCVEYKMECDMLPPVTKTLDIANQVHVRLMGINKKQKGSDQISHHFSGKNIDGSPLKGHRHVFIMPRDEDGDGRLDHLMVVCKERLDNSELVILDRLVSLWQDDGLPDIRLIPIRWSGMEGFQMSKKYLSVTPFVPPRYYRKGRGDFSRWLEEELRRECREQGIPEPVKITPIPSLSVNDREIPWSRFRRSRKGEEPRYGIGFRIEFDGPVAGPVALGYGSHFGLGQFIPEKDV
ncbi:MAG: type I-U CRISPR-associated protein Csb2 [Methanomassiliicoccales archaeon]|jgi:CRISPR-associated protein Csb2